MPAQLFATLDPTVRRLKLPHSPAIVLADTVGFVRDLPHELVAAFRSTLLEAREADLHLHVIDAADPERAERVQQVNEVLASIGAGAVPQLEVYNKIDVLGEPPRIERDAHGQARRVWLSAASGSGLELLRELLAERFGAQLARVRLQLSASHGRARAELYRRGAVLAERAADDGGCSLEVELAARELAEFCRREGLPPPVPLDSAACLSAGGFLQSRPAAAPAV